MRQVDGKKVYSVSEVNYFAKQTLEQMILWVEGEIASSKKNPNYNFYYLDLKDGKAVLPAIADGYMLEVLGEEINGQKIIAFGNLSLYEPFGKYQFKISRIEKAGEGDLQRRLEQLIIKLREEGLFDKKHKKELPKYPKKVCVVTSEGSDAYNDFKRHTIDKFPVIELFTADVRVQGPRSIPSLLKVLPVVDKKGYDLVVITRGGGSIEDLAAFNDEQVARAIFAMKTPTVVAVGHEANESLAEWVADVRASTPTDAAHIVTRAYNSLLSDLDNVSYRLKSKSDHYFSTNFQMLDHIYFRLEATKMQFLSLPHRLGKSLETLKRYERKVIFDSSEATDDLVREIKKGFKVRLQSYQETVKNLQRSLILLSPQNTLDRGYSITTNKKGSVLKSVASVVVGETIGVKLADGNLTSQVKTKKWQKPN